MSRASARHLKKYLKGFILDGPGNSDWLRRIRLVVITSGEPGGYLSVVSKAIAGGCRAVQLRDKQLDDRLFIEIALEIKKVCDTQGALFFVNDRVDVASIVGSSGVHLGVSDISVRDARGFLPPGVIIGYSPEGEDDAAEALGSGADYLGIGPVYDTGTKEDAGKPIGVEGLLRYCKKGMSPVIAVGGVNADRVRAVMESGVSGVAVSSAVRGAVDPAMEVRSILAQIEAGGV